MKKTSVCVLRYFLILTIFALFVTGCERFDFKKQFDSDGLTSDGEDNISLEYGFNHSNSNVLPTPNFCAYKSDTNTFAIDNVILEFFYGGYYVNGAEYELVNGRNYPFFELYFSNEDETLFFVKRVDENFVSEKYSCELVRDENCYITDIKFNFSESIAVPKEVFNKKKGIIYFQIHSIDQRDYEAKKKCIASVKIFYKVVDETVVLSNKEFD